MLAVKLLIRAQYPTVMQIGLNAGNADVDDDDDDAPVIYCKWPVARMDGCILLVMAGEEGRKGTRRTERRSMISSRRR